MTTSPTRLVWITPNAEDTIVYCARVSNPKGQEENKSPERLLRYLIKHKHWSPFEMASACVEINTTRDISTQILRHRSFSFQEFSQRYSDVTVLTNPPIPHLRRQDQQNRQASHNDLSSHLSPEQLASFYRRTQQLYEDAGHLYQEMVSSGVAKESARKVLPLNTPTRLYMSGTIRSWIHYLAVRCDEGTQLEHRQIATDIKSLLLEQLPSLQDLF
jgi:thymidylate synthase (FAD)